MSDDRPATDQTRILLVDDEPSVLHVTTLFLEDLGYEVVAKRAPEAALETLKAHAGRNVDLLMTDVVMPGMSGVELAARARELEPEIPVVFFSGHTEGVISGGAKTRFLNKPFYHKQLASVVRELLDARSRRPDSPDSPQGARQGGT